MSSLLIVKPHQPLVFTGTSGLGRTASPDPKEAANITAGGQVFIDMGGPVTADTLFIGYHTATADQQFAAFATGSDYSLNAAVTVAATQGLQQPGQGPPYHRLARFAPTTSRYWRIDMNIGTAGGGTPYLVGVVMFGASFQPIYGHEYGSGRVITDTGSAERLFGGGFGIDEGTRAGGWQWTLGDLTDAEVRTLYRLALDRGTTRSVLVVEDPDVTDGLNERIHWGLFSKLDPYERFAPGATRWGLRIDDWA